MTPEESLHQAGNRTGAGLSFQHGMALGGSTIGSKPNASPRMTTDRIDRLITDLRTFMLSYGDHDAECPGRDAIGPEAISDANCKCGFIGRMNALLAEVAERITTE